MNMDAALNKSTKEENNQFRGQVNPYLPYRKTLLSNERVKELSQLKEWRPIVDVLGCWAIIFFTWYLCAAYTSWWVVLLAIPVIGSTYYSLFIIGHDAFHRRVFKDAKKNDLFADWWIHGALGAINRINRKNHMAHHSFLATEADPDRHKHGCFNKYDKAHYLLFLTGLLNLNKAVYNVFLAPLFGGGATSEHSKASDSGKEERHGLEDLLCLFCWQAGLIAGLSYFIGWWAYPVLWLLPVYLFTYLADGIRSFAEHSHPESDQSADSHRLITYLSSPLERTIFAPMNMNYHAVHHLWPSIPYYNLPQADREVRQAAKEQGYDELEWRGSYINYLVRYYKNLPINECKPKGV